MPSSVAKVLVELITQAVEEIEADASRQIPGCVIHSANQTIATPEEELELTPQRRAAIRTLQASTHQLLATLMPIGWRFQELYLGFFQIVAMDIAARGRIADLIHSIAPDSSKGGVHIQVIAEKAGMNSDQLKHIMRFLALQNIFCELNPDHWGNNRGSQPLRTDSPNTQYNALGFFREDIALPALAELPNVLFGKKGSGGEEGLNTIFHRQTAFQKYYKTDEDFFDYLSKSEGGQKAKRFSQAMMETSKAKAHGDEASPYKEFQWQKKLGQNGTLIDVGGGIGAAAYPISTYLPGWNIVIQDRPEVIKEGKDIFRDKKSTAKIEFEEADFLKEQPPHRVGRADAYFLRNILHDWPFDSCVQILTHLRNAAKKTTRLLVCEMSLEPPILDPNSPILSNGGMASFISYALSLTMLTSFNAEERDKEEFAKIFLASGWVLQETSSLASLNRFLFEGVPKPDWRC